MSSRVSLICWGDGVLLALVDHSSSDEIKVKLIYGVDLLMRRPQPCTGFFSIGLVKTVYESSDQERLTLGNEH